MRKILFTAPTDASALAEHWNGGCIVVTRPDAEVPELPWLAVYSTSRSYALVFAVIAVALGG